jgi:hypothetical protein
MPRPGYYSDAEMAMFKALGVEGWPLNLTVNDLYPAIIQKVWMERMTGPAVESLRRCVDAFQNETPKRLTPEFDALVQLETTEVEGRQWIGVYVDNDEDAQKVLGLLQAARDQIIPDVRLLAIPSLDWDKFEPIEPEDEAELPRHRGKNCWCGGRSHG